LTLAAAVEQIGGGDCGRSRVPTDDPDERAAERLHPKLANWHCRPFSDTRRVRLGRRNCGGDGLVGSLSWGFHRVTLGYSALIGCGYAAYSALVL
jgi:hypothetical protein